MQKVIKQISRITYQRFALSNCLKYNFFVSANSQKFNFNNFALNYGTKNQSINNKLNMYFSSYPKHDLINMPLLSPTMEKGTIQKWNFKEGDKLKVGDFICEVETDKSVVGFEAQEEFYLAKILFPAGTQDIVLGQTIAVSCNKKEDIEKFKDFKIGEKNEIPPVQTPPTQASQQTQPKAQNTGKTYPRHDKIAMPSLSPTMEKGTIQKWNYKEGDLITTGNVLCEVETDKSVVGFEIQEDIYLAKILVPGGTADIALGQIIAIGVSKKDDVAKFADYTISAESSPAQTTSSASNTSPQSQPQQTIQTNTTSPSSHQSSTGRIFASPLARRLASEKSIDLSSIGSGSGSGGRIIAADLERAQSITKQQPQQTSQIQQQTQQQTLQKSQQAETSAPSKPQPTLVQAENPYFDTPLTNMRKVIAKRLIESKTTIPHFYLTLNVNVDRLLEARKRMNEQKDLKISVNDFVIKACALALRDIPTVNSQWQNDKIRTFHNADISIAVSTDGGLITPIVFSANTKGLSQISADVKELAKKAKANKLQPKEFQGGTFSISNLGMFGIDSFSAVINPPQACILAVGKTSKQLEVDETNTDKPYKISNVMNVTLSCDHRVVDGAVAAQWLNKFKFYIENPLNMLL